MYVFVHVCVPLCCVYGTCVCVCGLAQGSAPPRGWHSECIITINEKVNGAFSYISIYIWTIWAHKWCLGGRGQHHSALKQRGLMCFYGHQMLWIMMRPLNANQMTLDRPWSTVPAWKLSPIDTMKEKETQKKLPQAGQHVLAVLLFWDIMVNFIDYHGWKIIINQRYYFCKTHTHTHAFFALGLCMKA